MSHSLVECSYIVGGIAAKVTLHLFFFLHSTVRALSFNDKENFHHSCSEQSPGFGDFVGTLSFSHRIDASAALVSLFNNLIIL